MGSLEARYFQAGIVSRFEMRDLRLTPQIYLAALICKLCLRSTTSVVKQICVFEWGQDTDFCWLGIITSAQ
jgi:hypothetical protein